MTTPTQHRSDERTRAPGALTPALVVVGTATVVCLLASLAQPGQHLDLQAPALLSLTSRVVAVTASAGLLGCLLLHLCQPASTRPDRALLRSAAAWALVWTGALGTGFAVELASPGSISAHLAVGPDADLLAVRFRWLVLGIALAALVRILCQAARSRADVVVVAALVVCGLLVATRTGHGSSALSPTASSVALLAHVLAASAWTGGLLALAVHCRTLETPASGAPTARAYSRVALLCYVLLAGSGLLALLSRSSVDALLDSGGYLVVVLAKTGLLLVLGLLGAAQRRTGIVRLEAGDRSALLLLSAGELVLMAAALGLGVSLAHTAT